MAATEVAVAILWHMHQPDYADPVSGRVAMPWVRLHALQSYYDMVRLVREAPEARVVLNVVPTLLRQLEQAAAGDGDDEFLALARAEPAELSAAERVMLLQRFFAFHHGRRFAELPRLGELWRKREAQGRRLDARAAAAFTDAELRDLQVGFHLAWSGRTVREEPLVAALLRKGRGFTSGEKTELLAFQQDFLGRVLPAYRQFGADGGSELSCTPWAHPILPLLCDTRAALEAVPELSLPAVRFARPGDAWFHVRAALDETERVLGRRPVGMWPAEGSLSEAAIRVFAAAGVRWLGCDQDVLAASLGGRGMPAGGHFRPFRWGGAGMPGLFFRDKGLSDRIGFIYASWQAERAVADFVANLQRIRSLLPPGRFIVPIILDGENAWESYPANGVDFLSALYAGVAAAPGCRWMTFGEFLDAEGEAAAHPLDRLCAGSWIRRDFTTWIGHPEKNRAWERLAATRDWLEPRLASAGVLREVVLPGGASVSAPDPALAGPSADTPVARAWQEMAVAEGSDWFWWFGDDHPTEFAAEFDDLFRMHLGNVHRLLGEPIPDVLAIPVRARRVEPTAQPPRAPLEVVLDGRVTHYFEWLDAGRCEAGGQRGAMHQAVSPLSTLFYGGDPRRLLLRLDPSPGKGVAALAGLALTVHVLPVAAESGPQRADGAAARRAASLPLPPAGGTRGKGARGKANAGAGGMAVSDRVVEVALPWSGLGLKAGEEFAFFITLERREQVELRVPVSGTLAMRVPLGPDDAEDWLV